MAITFQCRCGKHLKARESNAGRRTACPGCGAPVRVPTRQPTHRGAEELSAAIIPGQRTFAPSPTRQRRHGARRKSRAAPVGALEKLFPWSRPKRSRRAAFREQDPEVSLRHPPRWTKLLGPPRPGAYPAADPIFGGGFVIAAISVVLAVSGGLAIQLVPVAQHGGWLRLPHSPLLAVAVAAFAVALAYAASFIGQSMAESAAGRGNEWRFDFEFDRAVAYGAGGLGNLLGGPILFLGGGLWYWLNCGEMTVLDGVIVVELALAGIAGWLALSCGSAAMGQFALNRPARFRRVLRKLGYRGLGLILGASLLIALHASVGVLSCRRIQNGDVGGVFWLGVCAFSGIVLTTLLLSRLSRMSARGRLSG